MTIVTASLVAQLRGRTGVGMMACKSALVECNGDIDEAIALLRKRGLASAAKKSGREALEGLISLFSSETVGVMVEVNSETDFVAKNAQFIELVQGITKTYYNFDGALEDFLNSKFIGSSFTVQEEILSGVSIIGENIKLGSAYKITGDYVAKYVHAAVASDTGRIGVLLAFNVDGQFNKHDLDELGNSIAMHIAAAKPRFVSITAVDKLTLENELDVAKEKARLSGKPDSMLEKIAEGRVRKFYEEVVLLEQNYALDEKIKISSLIEGVGNKLKIKINLKGFIRLSIGDPDGNIISII
ncbi:Elongation factor Ts [Candidatus Cyrtobacter comes]|uniref:Elongation factor Ts n=1 Tax=Candidatus Cyrtobacter comes TaxID=675776 RepID=A0ABU5L8J5_9RICK|nr:translation elongation factor Ts [Candidatus Cyrtobacter comes]MDZ5762433.1 Elongation factor Ts [Candidatus Cyrtobacter comes]